MIYDRSPSNIFSLFEALNSYPWSGLSNAIDSKTIDVDTAFNDFYKIINWHVNRYIPRRTVTMKSRDPGYITPRLKLLLRKRNKLYRLGHTAAGDQLPTKINKIISENRKRQLCSAYSSDNAKSGLCYIVATTGEPQLNDFITAVMSVTLTSILKQ